MVVLHFPDHNLIIVLVMTNLTKNVQGSRLNVLIDQNEIQRVTRFTILQLQKINICNE